MTTQDPTSAAMQRWHDLFNRANGRRRVFCVYGGDEPLPPIPNAEAFPENKTGRIENAWQNYRQMLDRRSWIGDDSIPFADVYTGTEIFAHAFGCGVYRHENSNPSARPLITRASQVALLKVPSLDCPPLAVLFEIGDELRRRGGADLIMKIPDIQSPVDIAALIWNKTDFYYAMIDAPEAVHELATKCRQLLTAFCDEWFSRYGRAFIAHYPPYYMPQGLTLSEDEIGCVNREMAEEFFLPHLNALSDHFGGLGIHCCANARHQWDTFLKIRNLRVLNITQGPAVTADAYRFFNEKVIHVHDGQPDGADMPAWIDANAPAAPVLLREVAATREEAIEKCARLREWADGKW
ncbi:MAG: uroporphyrinogen decarboxylase family protein [Planctomycetaceae bacterium]|nr:hypothetical protein [Planctomycetaceae bacterium]